jgi:hypothetical protein
MPLALLIHWASAEAFPLDDDEMGDPVAAAYGPNYRRLQRIKSKYDPKNFFRMNQNIRPLISYGDPPSAGLARRPGSTSE